MFEFPFVTIDEVWEYFHYKSASLAQRAINRGSFPIPTYKHGGKHVIDRQTFNAYFLIKQEASLKELLRQIEEAEENTRKIRKYAEEKLWYNKRNAAKLAKQEFPEDLDPEPPQEWDPADEFPDELPPEPEPKPLPEIELDGYYIKRAPAGKGEG